MKLLLYSFQDEEAEKIKEFLNKNNLLFREIKINERNLNEVRKLSWQDKVSTLKIIKNHGIEIVVGFNNWHLAQLIEHIKKYRPRIEV